MLNFRWTERHAVFVPEIDAEHQSIYKLCGDSQRALASRAAGAQVHSLLSELAVHCLEHFWHEERRMRATGYPFYPWHRQQHQTARARMAGLQARIREGDRGAALELLQFLHGWLDQHIRIADRMLGAHLRNRQREFALRAS